MRQISLTINGKALVVEAEPEKLVRRRELPAQSLLDDDRGGGDSVRAGENVAMI